MSDSDPSSDALSRDWIDATSISLLQRIKQEDSQAWERLVRLYSPLVASWCRKAGLSNEDISDVLQDVFRSVYTSVERFRHDGPRDTFRGWLRVITRNKLNDFFTMQQRLPQVAGGTEQLRIWQQVAAPFPNDDDEQTERSETSIVFHRGLELVRAEFEDKTWKAFWRAAIDGLSPEDVAHELNMSRLAVYKAKSRVLSRLRKELGAEEQ